MEIILWLGVMVAIFVFVSATAAYHNRIIDNRPKVEPKVWD